MNKPDFELPHYTLNYEHVLSAFVSLVEAHIAEGFTMEEIASSMNTSTRTLSRAIKQEYRIDFEHRIKFTPEMVQYCSSVYEALYPGEYPINIGKEV